MRDLSRWCAGALLLACTCLGANALADTKSEARSHFQAGLALLQASSYDSAAREFEQSVHLFPTASALFNLANCYRALGRHAEALTALRTLKREHGEKLRSDMAEAVARHQAELQGQVAELVVRVDHAGATVKVGERSIGESPLSESVLVDPGQLRVEVTLEGYEPARKELVLAAGESQTLSLQLELVRAPLTLRVNVAGATVYVDDEAVGETPLGSPIRLAPGQHAIRVSKPGYSDSQQQVEAVSGAALELDLELTEERPAASPARPAGPPPATATAGRDTHPPSAQQDASGPPTLFWVGATSTAVATLAGGVFWGLAHSRYSDFQDYSEQYRVREIDANDPDLVAAQDDTDRYRSLALGFGIAAGVLAVGTLVVYLIDDDSENEPPEQVVARSRGDVRVRF